MKSFSRGQRLTVHVDRLSIGGRGVARHEGLVIFIADVAPDEDVEIELTKVKKNFAEARLLRITRASPSRVQPACPVAGICGGCSWQHVSYSEQLLQKRALVREALLKFSGFDVSAMDSVSPTWPSPKEFRYRNRIQLHQDGGKVGFYKRGSHDIVDIQDCPITEEPITNLIPSLHDHARAEAARIELYLSGNGSVGRRSSGPSSEDNLPDDLSTGPAFSQVNTGQNQNLINFVVQALQAQPSAAKASVIYDLYAGNGNFTFPIAHAFPNTRIFGVELNSENITTARQVHSQEPANFQLQFVLSDVERFIEQEAWNENCVVVLDPPRTGCGVSVMKALAARRPSLIIYVSCHPVTLARDITALADGAYQLVIVQPFDMFPQTDHVETVSVFRRI